MSFVTSGTVLHVTKEWSSISVCIDATKKILRVNKSQFYSFNIQCENMRNILEKRMEINVCYKLLPGSVIRVLTAWVGEPPDGFDSELEPLKPVYDEQGVFSTACSEGFLVDSNCGTVFIEQVNFFIDGAQISAPVSVTDELQFDAVPMEEYHASGATYVATCAWTGRKPLLIQRIRPRFEVTSVNGVKDYSGSRITGTIRLIMAESVAIADAKLDDVFIQVLVFRRSFGDSFDRIRDVVKIGDRLSMSINYSFLFQGRSYWFAERASSTSEEITLNDSESGDERSKDESVEAGTLSVEPINVDCPGTSNKIQESIDPCLVMPKFDDGFLVLYDDPSLQGVLSRYMTHGCITYDKYKIFLDRSNLFVDGKGAGDFLDCDFLDLGKTFVDFEAVSSNRYSGFKYEATLAWVGKKPKLESILPSLPTPKWQLAKKKEQEFYGIIRKLLLPSFALIDIPGLSATVVATPDSFLEYGIQNMIRNRSFFISDFIGLNYCVKFKIRKSVDPAVLKAHSIKVLHCSEKLFGKVSSGCLSLLPLLKPTKKVTRRKKE